MRKDRFERIIGSLIPSMRRSVRRNRVSTDLVNDAVSEVIAECFEKNLYLKFNAAKVKGVLCRRTQWKLFEIRKREERRAKHVLRLPEEEFNNVEAQVTHEDEITTCPFCHQGDLNMYGACVKCHTVLPSNLLGKRTVLSLEEVDLSVSFDYEKESDVKKALATLTDRERQIVQHFVLGHETLEGLAEMLGGSATSLWRQWLVARSKLQTALADYATLGLSEKRIKPFQAALKQQSQSGV